MPTATVSGTCWWGDFSAKIYASQVQTQSTTDDEKTIDAAMPNLIYRSSNSISLLDALGLPALKCSIVPPLKPLLQNPAPTYALLF